MGVICEYKQLLLHSPPFSSPAPWENATFHLWPSQETKKKLFFLVGKEGKERRRPPFITEFSVYLRLPTPRLRRKQKV